MQVQNKYLKIKDQGTFGLWGLFLTSGCGEYPGCRISMYCFNHSVDIPLPRIIKPKKHYHTFVATWEEGRPTKGYDVEFERQFGWTYIGNHVSIKYGHYNSDWSRSNTDGLNSKSISFFLPWGEWEFQEYIMYGLDLKSVMYRSKHGGADRDQPTSTITYSIKDSDGEELEATCFVESRRWSRGVKWCSWLKYIAADRTRKNIDISFSKESGHRKGSWKGGVIGTSEEVLSSDSSVLQPFKRYCVKHDMQIIKELHRDVHPK